MHSLRIVSDETVRLIESQIRKIFDNRRPGGLMVRRCFPVSKNILSLPQLRILFMLVIGKDCGFESRLGRKFLVKFFLF